jgi:hypothetical protein
MTSMVMTAILVFGVATYRDVQEGRRELNFSEWQNGSREGLKPAEIKEQIAAGKMPPWQYRLVHD